MLSLQALVLRGRPQALTCRRLRLSPYCPQAFWDAPFALLVQVRCAPCVGTGWRVEQCNDADKGAEAGERGVYGGGGGRGGVLLVCAVLHTTAAWRSKCASPDKYKRPVCDLFNPTAAVRTMCCPLPPPLASPAPQDDSADPVIEYANRAALSALGLPSFDAATAGSCSALQLLADDGRSQEGWIFACAEAAERPERCGGGYVHHVLSLLRVFVRVFMCMFCVCLFVCMGRRRPRVRS